MATGPSRTQGHVGSRRLREKKQNNRELEFQNVYMNSNDTNYSNFGKMFLVANRLGSRTHCRQEGLHVLIGICYCGQVNKVSVQDLLIPEKNKTERHKESGST